MTRFIMSLVVLITILSTTPASGKVILTDNSGGSVLKFERIVIGHKKSRTPVEFKNLCMSACTMFLKLPSEQLCYHDTAIIVFHQVVEKESRKFKPEQTQKQIQSYPQWIQDFLNERGALVDPAWIHLPNEILGKHIRKCS